MNSDDVEGCILALVTGIFFGSMILLVITNPMYITVAVSLGLFFIVPWMIFESDR